MRDIWANYKEKTFFEGGLPCELKGEPFELKFYKTYIHEGEKDFCVLGIRIKDQLVCRISIYDKEEIDYIRLCMLAGRQEEILRLVVKYLTSLEIIDLFHNIHEAAKDVGKKELKQDLRILLGG